MRICKLKVIDSLFIVHIPEIYEYNFTHVNMIGCSVTGSAIGFSGLGYCPLSYKLFN